MQNTSKTNIKEIFSSIQGEGLFVGEKHVFVRFSKCNLNCSYCDTDFLQGEEYTTEKLYEVLTKKDAEVISFTGGEPLADVEFLYDFLKKYKKKLNKKIYLETNGTKPEELKKIIKFIDIVAMDIKIKSAGKEENRFLDNEKFLKIANKKQAFVKVVFNNDISDEEIKSIIKIVKKQGNILVLQPQMPLCENFECEKIYNKFYEQYKKIRLIPQVHKFLNIV